MHKNRAYGGLACSSVYFFYTYLRSVERTLGPKLFLSTCLFVYALRSFHFHFWDCFLHYHNDCLTQKGSIQLSFLQCYTRMMWFTTVSAKKSQRYTVVWGEHCKQTVSVLILRTFAPAPGIKLAIGNLS